MRLKNLKTLSETNLVAKAITYLVIPALVTSCASPSLVEMARRRQAGGAGQIAGAAHDDVRIKYAITDWDVLNFTDEVERKLASHSRFHTAAGFGTAGAAATLGTLAGAAKVLGWSASTASGLGIGATYVFGMGQLFDSKAHAVAFEQAATAVQAAQASFYFRQLGMAFNKVDGRNTVDLSKAQPKADIPSQAYLTPDGETLYYRVTKILRVLDDTLAAKIPNLEDLKEAHGESASGGSPMAPPTAPPINTPPSPTPPVDLPPPANVPPTSTPPPANTGSPRAAHTPKRAQDSASPPPVSDSPRTASKRESDAAVLQSFGWPNGIKNEANFQRLTAWLQSHKLGDVDPATFIHAAVYAAERRQAVQDLKLAEHEGHDAASAALRNFVWPGGKRNEANADALRKWMNENALGDVDPVIFIVAGSFAKQRQTAVAKLIPADHDQRDAAGDALQKFAFPGQAQNPQNLAELRKWMDTHGLSDIDPVIFIRSDRYPQQRKAAISDLGLVAPPTRDPNTTKLMNYLWPSGKEDKDHAGQLRAWMDMNTLDSTDLTSFIHGSVFAAQRQSAVTFLHL